MKKAEIEIGGHYMAKVSGRLTVVRVNNIQSKARWNGTKTTQYDVTNLLTTRVTTFHSAAKFRHYASPQQIENVKKLRDANLSGSKLVAADKLTDESVPTECGVTLADIPVGERELSVGFQHHQSPAYVVFCYSKVFPSKRVVLSSEWHSLMCAAIWSQGYSAASGIPVAK